MIGLTAGVGGYGVYGGYGWTPSVVRTAAPRSQPDAPVQPAAPARTVQADQGASRPLGRQLPVVWSGADPVEMAVRGRIEYLDPSQDPAKAQNPADPEAAQAAEDPAKAAQGAEETKSPRETMEEGECQTCKERKYQDGSNDPGVSFKTPGHIAPEQAAAKVRGHEMEHVSHERAKAAREDRKVVSQTVTMHTAICPECGRVYVSGGTTRTATAAASRTPAQYPSQEDDAPQFQATA